MARAEGIVGVLAVGIGLLVLYQVFAPALFAPRGNEGEPIDVPHPATVYDPVTSEPLPDGFRQLLPRDGIAPVYEPRFVSAESAGYPDDALVLGVEIGGESHAYPINVLNWREMVIDRVGDVPILATW